MVSNLTGSSVREGMVFVSMNKDDLLMRTAQYQIEYVPSRPTGGPGLERETRPLAPVASIRHNDDGSLMTRAQIRQQRQYSIASLAADEDDEEEEEARRAQIPSEFAVAPPPFRVTMECSDEENDDVPHPRYRRRAPNRIGSLPFESDSSDEWTHAESSSMVGEIARNAYRHLNGSLSGSLSLIAEADASQLATQGVGGELMAPHAKFFIEKDMNKCTIRFDPPVSGRYILLKMWNPQDDSSRNIDIQGVVAKGFAGPRYFPAVELR